MKVTSRRKKTLVTERRMQTRYGPQPVTAKSTKAICYKTGISKTYPDLLLTNVYSLMTMAGFQISCAEREGLAV